MALRFAHLHRGNHTSLIRRVVSKLSLTRLEVGSSFSTGTLFDYGVNFGHFSNLHTLSIRGRQSCIVVLYLNDIPSLRRIELEDSFAPANIFPDPAAWQVTQIVYIVPLTRMDYLSPLSALHFFPSATIVKLELTCFRPSQHEAIPSILAKLTSTLRVLRLRTRLSARDSKWIPIDKLLPQFPSLEELHLDQLYLSHDPHKYLHSLPHLIDLSLVLEDLSSDFLKLIEGPQRLRYLRMLRIEFGPIEVGATIDLSNAMLEHGEEHWDEDGNGMQLLYQTDSFTEMGEWRLPLGNELMDGTNLVGAFELAEKMERQAKEADIRVSTNLTDLRRAFYRQLVEFHNRRISNLYLDCDKWMCESARELAESFKVNLPTLEIDLKEEIGREKLDWFKVRMQEVEVDGKRECYALNLRLKK